MITISRTFEWDMGHRVTNHDSLCKNPHGHRYKMIIQVTGPLNDKQGSPYQGMVFDFGLLKELIISGTVGKLDHCFMYWQEDTVMRSFAVANKDLKMHAVPFIPTVECIAQYLADEIVKLFKDKASDIALVSLRLFETPNSQAEWRKNV